MRRNVGRAKFLGPGIGHPDWTVTAITPGGQAINDDERDIDNCDLCIVGAGLAGMNALAVASRYLGRHQRVILIDRRERPGGMWVDTYPYVRLHQPHAMFTAGDIPWTLGRDRGYLATQPEVLDHFEHCLDVIRERVTVDEMFGWELESYEETDGRVRLVCRAADGRRRVIATPRLIKAGGFAVTPNPPLRVDSTQVRSVSPNFCDVRTGEINASDAPVWVIGGGKTGMDTAHALITADPGREVNMVAGSGTFFLNRDRSFPPGLRRWWSGTMASASGAQMMKHFDGTNESEAGRWFRDAYATWPTPDADTYVLGIMSEAESHTIATGLNDTVMDRFVDVVDGANGPQMRLASGKTRALAPGSWIVNCTGYLLRDADPYEPYLSAGGSVMSIQLRSATMHLSSFMAYFMTHMFFLGSIADAPLYELDAIDFRRKSKIAMPFGLLCVAQHNLSVMYELLPRSAFLQCHLSVDRWYPQTRQLVAALKFIRGHRRDRDSARVALDILRERFDLRCGPLVR